MISQDYTIHCAGDRAIVIEFGETITSEINSLVLDVCQQIDAMAIPGIVETIPTFRSLMVQYDPDLIEAKDLIATIASISPGSPLSPRSRRVWSLPVCYEEDFGIDLGYVSGELELSPRDFIECHSSHPYVVFMLGFLPGQPYMGELPQGLRLSRRKAPRLRIPAGSIGIATSLTCVFPTETPCGWHVVGRTPVAMWNLHEGERPLFSPGDLIKLSPISANEYEDILHRVTKDAFRLEPVEGEIACHPH